MAKDPLPAKIDRIIELRERLQDEEDFTNHHVQELYAEYRKLHAQAVAVIQPIMQRWLDAGIIRVDCRAAEDQSIVFEPKSIYINGSLTLKCTPQDKVQT